MTWVSIDQLLEADEERRMVRCRICPITFETERDRESHETTHEDCPTEGCEEFHGHPGFCTPHRKAIRPHCYQGHEFTVENTLWTRDGKDAMVRKCRACTYLRKHGVEAPWVRRRVS